MKTKQKITVELVPSARRLVPSMREAGYDFVHAIADIVDNSIEAHASKVVIDMQFEGDESWVRVSDNGTGMSGVTITEAMRFGTKRDYQEDELGKFGLGLKTASFSQCPKFTVASRTNPNARRIEVRQWDLEHVKNTDRWEIINISPEERTEKMCEPLEDTVGTVVLWEQLDRVLGYKVPWGDRARTSFYKLAEELDEHLGMVFHRFLAGEARRRKKLKITLNETSIEPWDPYARDEKETISLPKVEFDISGDEGNGLVVYTPFILPPQEKFSSIRAFNHYAGPSKWNFQQGFYVYRADRMIQGGGWCHMRTSDEHTKLARIALDFWPDLDSAFEVNFAKTRVILPADLRVRLKPLVEELAKKARKTYTPVSNKPIPLFNGVGANTQDYVTTSPMRNGTEQTAVPSSTFNPNGNLGRLLEEAAIKVGEVPAFIKIKNALKTDNPIAARDIGWSI